MLPEETPVTRLKPHSFWGLLPGLALAVCLFAWLSRTTLPVSVGEEIALFMVLPLLFSSIRRRPFWFFFGIAAGAILVEQFPKLHNYLPRWLF